MKRIHLILLLGAILTLGDTPPPSSKTLKEFMEAEAAKITALPIAKAQFFLYSLNPGESRRRDDSNAGEAFHHHIVLGKAQITNAEDKNALMSALAKGIRESDPERMMCFNPRHGIRLIIDSSTNDFLICFECQLIKTFGFNDDKSFSTTPSPAPLFNEILDKYKLKREPPPSAPVSNPFE
jgi:hypothetical protein